MVDELTAFNGAYVRRDGRWLYSLTGTPVPGAQDKTLAGVCQLFYADRVTRRDGHVEVPQDLVALEPEFAWLKEADVTGAEHPDAPLLIPGDVWEQRAHDVVGLWAPELTADRLLDIAEMGALFGVHRSTISVYASQGKIPPLGKIAHCPYWSRPVAELYLRARQEGGAPRVGRPRTVPAEPAPAPPPTPPPAAAIPRRRRLRQWLRGQ
jgi:hypothetical protein